MSTIVGAMLKSFGERGFWVLLFSVGSDILCIYKVKISH